jgi:hypothetical protein
MAVDVQTDIMINRSSDATAKFASDPDNAPRWYVNIKTVEWKTPRPLRIGTLVTFAARFLGRELTYTYEVVEFIAGRRLVMRTAEGPFPMETTYEFEAIGPNQARMYLRNRGKPSGFARLLAPFVSFAIHRATHKDLVRLKAVLERTA